MVQVTDKELLAHAERIQSKVLVITGGGSGIGKETAKLYAKYKAKVVIGDINTEAAQAVAQEINSSGGTAVAQRCDVTVWEDQVALFDLAMETYGSVDVVIPNAGYRDVSGWYDLKRVDGKLAKPIFPTIEVNLVGVLYTCGLAMTYLIPEGEKITPTSVKALVFIGSVAALTSLPGSVLYTASKHGVLGIQRAISPVCTARGIRTGSVHPWFVETPFIADLGEFTSGWPKVPVERVAATCLAVATNPDPKTSECPWIMPDGNDVERVHSLQLNEAFYAEMNERVRTRLGSDKPFAV